ncbi:hypothetical protein [Rhizobium hidalgonense]|uniref:hypothetical protein n=1 Tax=Rhizobium hidalgonense TaxID=1538159 RepID=UPI002872A5A3|nr:hypothetical protein [Rhizobium hidalgonense]MDR9808450.1 hypothetical protein [Rhizobium hidalgonense]
MHPRFVTAFLKSSGDAGIVVMEYEGAQRVVIVDREALRQFSSPPRADETRLQESVGAICEIAASKILLDGDAAFSPVKVSADDVADWQTSRKILH